MIDALTASGHAVWWDGLLRSGERFAKATEAALDGSRAVVVLWSAASVESDWVRDEATSGRDRHRMVSVSLDGTTPPLGFRQIQYVDLSGWRGDPSAPEFRDLLGALATVEREPQTRPGPASVPSRAFGRSTRRGALAAAGGAAVAGLGGLALWRSGWLGSGETGNSIAILPFANLSGDPGQAYFSDGLTEELRATLSLNPQIQVVAQASSEKLRAEAGDALAVAGKLKVANVLSGSVRRSGDRLRIVATLVDAAKGVEAWSKAFDRTFAEVLTVQQEIAVEVVDALLASIGKSNAQTARLGGTRNPAALDAYLKGKALYEQVRDEQSDRAALASFRRATELDPGYAAAFAAASRANTAIASSYASGAEMRPLYDRALADARKAIALAPNLAEGHAALGFALFNGRLDLAAAQRPYEKSYELGFGNAPVLVSYAVFASRLGQTERAIQAITRAERIDPLNANVFRTAGLVAVEGRDWPRARTAARAALALDPKISTAHRILGDLALVDRDYRGAVTLFKKEPAALSRLRGLAIAYHKLGDAARADQAVADLQAEFGDNSLYQQAEILAQRGDRDGAFAALEKGFAFGDSGMLLLPSDPLLDPLRADPRFAPMVRRLGIEPPQPPG